MVSTNYTATKVTSQTPPIVAELQQVFANLDDSRLINELEGSTRRGPKGYPARTLWQAFITKHYMGLSCTRDLIRTLNNNPWIANTCGFDWPDIPHEATFSRFFKRLSSRSCLSKVKDVSRSMVERCYDELPGFGQRVALDSSTIKAWSNGGKEPHSDPDAGWSVKTNTQGQGNEYVYGYKLHALFDCEYELPVAVTVSAGNVHDSQRASNVLREARYTTDKFKPDFVIADKGYSSKPLVHLIRRQYSAQPVIDIPSGHKKLLAEFGDLFRTPEYKALKKQRQSVERGFSRLKGQRSLNSLRVRRWRKVTLHSYLSLIALQSNYFSGGL